MEKRLTFQLRARFAWWQMLNERIWKSPPRGANPYITHLPVLFTLRRFRRFRRVLELGCGEGSTLAFLDRSCFPEVERLVSYENDLVWAERVEEMAHGDRRLCMKVRSGSMAKAVAEEELGDYDLVFIDDSRTIAERSETISTIAARRPQTAVVVIHDFEILEYRYAALAFKHRCRITGLSPNVGVLWNRGGVARQPLRTLNHALHNLPTTSYPSDRRGWLAWVEEHVGQ